MLILIIVLVIGIWLIIEFKRFKHKILAVFLIVLILFTYFSFSAVIKDRSLDLKTFDGMKEAGRLYVLWFGNLFTNMKVVTSNAIDMNWGINESNNSTNSTKINFSKI